MRTLALLGLGLLLLAAAASATPAGYNCSSEPTGCYNHGSCVNEGNGVWRCYCVESTFLPNGDRDDAEFKDCRFYNEQVSRDFCLYMGVAIGITNAINLFFVARGLLLLKRSHRLTVNVQSSALAFLGLYAAVSVAYHMSNPYDVRWKDDNPWKLLWPFIPEVFIATAYNLLLLFFKKLTSRLLRNTRLTSRNIVVLSVVSSILLLLLCIYASVNDSVIVFMGFFLVYLTVVSVALLVVTRQVRAILMYQAVAVTAEPARPLVPLAGTTSASNLPAGASNGNNSALAVPAAAQPQQQQPGSARLSAAGPGDDMIPGSGRLRPAGSSGGPVSPVGGKPALSLQQRRARENGRLVTLGLTCSGWCLLLMVVLCIWSVNNDTATADAAIGYYYVVHQMGAIWCSIMLYFLFPTDVARPGAEAPTLDGATRPGGKAVGAAGAAAGGGGGAVGPLRVLVAGPGQDSALAPSQTHSQAAGAGAHAAAATAASPYTQPVSSADHAVQRGGGGTRPSGVSEQLHTLSQHGSAVAQPAVVVAVGGGALSDRGSGRAIVIR